MSPTPQFPDIVRFHVEQKTRGFIMECIKGHNILNHKIFKWIEITNHLQELPARDHMPAHTRDLFWSGEVHTNKEEKKKKFMYTI